jgi:UDP-N-acetylglucosamine 4,6-dehydratase|tara:strand:- start:503 stop:1414 length:912 start_codon:yes stop_codon:yes gene_type:complete
MKVLITGGSGTIGRAFIKNYAEFFDIFSYSRDENKQTQLTRNFPNVKQYLGSVEDRETVFRIFEEVKPDIVVHAAAVKHINLAEKQPIQTCKVNIVGSLNIIEASIRTDVPVTVAISTDKACSYESVYGGSKWLMERCFLEANSNRNKFSVCRFANVAHSDGSVLPFWLKQKEEGKALKLTDPKMNRLMFTQDDAANLIYRTVDYTRKHEGGFVCSYKMKCVNMFDLAKAISDNIEIVGKRPGEKRDEDLISKHELPYTYVKGNDIHIRAEENIYDKKLEVPYNSHSAEKMTSKQIKELVEWN